MLVDTDDPLFARIGHLDRDMRVGGKCFFTSWSIKRRYSAREIMEAQLLHAWPRRIFEPCGEECGTKYNDELACDHVFAQIPEKEVFGHRMPASIDACGVGARQVTPLYLDGRRIPRGVDVARTIAGEVIVTMRVIEAFEAQRVKGVKFEAVRLSNKDGTPSTSHYQLNVVGPPVEMSSETLAGEDPFDDAGYGRCPRGHTIGLNLLSEVVVKGDTVPMTDVMVARQMVGARRGLLRACQVLLLSPRAWRVIESARLKGLEVEISRIG